MRAEIAALRETEFVEYERVARLKLTALERIFGQFLEARGPAHLGRDEFDAYVLAQGRLLDDYAVYCALDEEMHRRDANVWLWTDWPEGYRDPRSAAVREFAAATSRTGFVFQIPAMADRPCRRPSRRPARSHKG